MSVFDLDTEGQAALAQQAAANPIAADQVMPGFFTKIPKAIGMGVMKGGAKTGDFMATVGSFFDEPGVDYSDADKLQEEIRQQSLDYWTPQANEVGTAGRVLGGASEMVLPLMVTGGDPAVMLGSEAIGTGKDLINQGVDAKTATKVAMVQTTASSLGFKLPFLGSTLASRVASGVVGNEALGIAARTTSGKLLGDQPAADQFKPLDAESLAIDGIMGAAFGGLAHVSAPRMAPSTVDAALTANNAKHFQHDTAPGLPADWNASIAHQDAMEAAINQELQGEPVNVGHTNVQHADFVPRETSPTPEIPIEHQISAAPHENVNSPAQADTSGYHVNEEVMTDEQIKAFQGLRSDIPSHQDVGAVGEGAPAEQGSTNDGGPRAASGEPLTVYRGSEQPLSAEHFNTEALGKASGHPSSGLGVFFTNDPVEASRYGSIVEAKHLDIRNPKIIKFEHLPGFDSLDEATKFREKLKAKGYDGIVLDASHLGGPVQYVAFDPKQVVHSGVHEAIHRGFKAEPAQQHVHETAGTRDGQQPEQKSGGGKLNPTVESARKVAAASDTKIPTGEFNADGTPQTASAHELMTQAEADIQQAHVDSKAFEAAVTCFLSKGGS